MADVKDKKREEDLGRTAPYSWSNPRPKAEIVEEAYDHEEPTPTQAECDEAKLASIGNPNGSGDPQSADAQSAEETKRRQAEAKQGENRQVEAGRSGGYQTRSAESKKPE